MTKGWKPISTAPTWRPDESGPGSNWSAGAGPHILVAMKGAGWVHEAYWRPDLERWVYVDGRSFVNEPTHWMPLPEPDIP